MSFAPDLVLRDIHEPSAPNWWPPAPGWWIVAACLLAVAGWFAWRRWHRRAVRRRVERVFDETLAAHTGSAQRIAAMSELLRRASRRRDPAADRLQGEDWLHFLDEGLPQPDFTQGIGRTLLEGGFRRTADDVDLDALQRLVRARFLDWMAPR